MSVSAPWSAKLIYGSKRQAGQVRYVAETIRGKILVCLESTDRYMRGGCCMGGGSARSLEEYKRQRFLWISHSLAALSQMMTFKDLLEVVFLE